MKKINVFLLILLVFSIFICIPNKSNSVQADNLNIKISFDEATTIYSHETDIANYSFVANYADNSSITFEAKLYDGEIESTAQDLTYMWEEVSSSQAESGIVVSNNKFLTLDKIFNDDEALDANLITVGEKKFRITISGTSISQKAELSIKINDTDGQIILTKFSRELPFNNFGEYVADKNSSYFSLSAILCKPAVDHTINWYLKTPNSSTFDLYKENGDCNINPADLFVSQNGFGKYYLYASAQTSSVLFTSKMIVFNVKAGEVNAEPNHYNILKSIISNTKASIEAFTFKLDNASADGLDFNKILWFINGVKSGKGESFSYEPTTTTTFVITAQYQGANLIKLAEISTTPKSTGTLTMILYIAGAIAVLSLIFGISLKIQNKKRDVVW